ncbi:dihydrodipicolinate synthase family protein [Gemmata sp. G18]|uniref:Dihydrodipicolinate synthase family protein n=1 Tax=Gemmata palustris TaxID=2822762 RepID=A0ABS5C348_9BACT|nr:dihydrodipicolinate synthase family protein [Gemmata palustris]MBP3960386.1 dihydrodipicolinate synthase family protein [Gemmata palustris]
MPKKLHGVLAIAHTPFTDGDEIDELVLKREVEWAFGVGANGVGTGMVSETMRLTDHERVSLANMLVGFAGNRGPVFVAVGAESTKQSLAHAKAAEREGCDAVMAVPPLTSKLSEAHLVDHFRALADGIGIPVIVQDASGYVGQSIPISVCVKLLEQYGPDKILFKPEAAPNGPTLSALRDATSGKATIFEGSGGIFLVDSYRRGIAGTMPGMDLLDGIVAVWKALQRGDDATAYRVSFPIGAIVALQLQAGLDGFLAVEKYLMHKRGLFPSVRRRKPYGWELDAETATEVDRLFAHLQEALGTPP